ncbi:MAG TPA: sulfotransferase [Solirubrobacterales bacterium]|nr:sulfotransferase [Solirubrobacterales bacterium]
MAGRLAKLLGRDRLADLEPRLTWIWGAPRSGSSWLLQLLADPLDVDLNAPLGFVPPALAPEAEPAVVPVDELLFASHLVPWDGEPVEVFGEWWPGSINGYSSGRPTYFLSDAYAETWRPEMRRLLLARLAAVVERARAAVPAIARHPAIAIKETPSGHGADQVMQLLPRSRAVLLLRDPRDVVDSLLHAFQPGGFMATQYGQSYSTPDERAAGAGWGAKLWAMSVDVGAAALARHDPALGRTVRYEDLLADTAAELGALIAWIGVERDPAAVAGTVERRSFARAGETGELRRIRSASPGRWRENLSEREIGIVTGIAGERLERFGYER